MARYDIEVEDRPISDDFYREVEVTVYVVDEDQHRSEYGSNTVVYPRSESCGRYIAQAIEELNL